MIQVDEVTFLPERQKLIRQFCSLTDYSTSDILAFSSVTRLFLTRNGGTYKLGDEEVEHLKGPSPDSSERI